MSEFQTSVELDQPIGVPGNIATDVEVNGTALTITSLTAGNVIGYACTRVAGKDDECIVGGTGEFAGVLALPNATASGCVEDGINFLQPINSQAMLISKGAVFVELGAAANIGDALQFDQATGEIKSLGWGVAATAAHTIIRNAKVDYRNLPAAGVAIIKIVGV